jgi:L-threonylcarbamoyladenylate synthase
VAFPTETVYGLGANALDPSAVERIYVAKGRPAYNPLIVHVADVAAARNLVREWPDEAERLADAFWPGPLTLVLPKRPMIPDAVTANLSSVAVRVPAHPVARALLIEVEIPAAPRNRSALLSPTTGAHVEVAWRRTI